MSMASNGTVRITKTGRSATIQYVEGPDQPASFDAELGGGKVLLVIYAPPPPVWPQRFPWAATRRDAVLERIAREVIRRESFGSRFRIHDSGVDILMPVLQWRSDSRSPGRAFARPGRCGT